MKRNLLIAALAGSVCSVAALADGSITNTAAVVNTTTTWQSTLTIPQFDSSLGTLASITYTITGTVTGTAQASNNSTSSTDDVTLNLSAKLRLSDSLGTTLVQSVPLLSTDELLAKGDGTGDVPHYVAPSGITLNGLSVGYNQVNSSSSDLGLFIGTGTIDLTMKATAQSGGIGDSGNDTFNFTTFADASITVVYNYTTPVPEASTWAAIGFIGMAGGATYLRRRQLKASV